MKINTENKRGLSLKPRQAAREILLLCTTTSISPQNRNQLSQYLSRPIDWKYLVDLASFHGIIPLITHNLVSNGMLSKIPRLYRSNMIQTYHGAMYRNLTLSSELDRVISTFNEHGIETICLKGVPLIMSLYRNLSLRSTADIDILVHYEDRLKAANLLVNLGYQQVVYKTKTTHTFHIEFFKKNGIYLVIELHYRLENPNLVCFPEQEIWRRAQPLQLEGASTLTLSPEDNSLFLANHLFKHEDNLLKLLEDISELFKNYKESLDWDYIDSSARKWSIIPVTYYAFLRTKELLDTPIPDFIFEKWKPGFCRRWLIDCLISRESFLSPIGDKRLRSWTAVIAHSLMMKNIVKMLYVLSGEQDRGNIGKLLKSFLWVLPVFVVAFWRKTH